MLGPAIRGLTVSLAPPSLQTAMDYTRWLADRRITRYVDFRDGIKPGREQDWLNGVAGSPADILWAIIAKDRCVGLTGIYAIDWRNLRGNTGIIIGDSSAWGRGYATEAVRLRTQYAFSQTKLEKLQAEVFAGNIGGWRCIQKIGYMQYGMSRRHVLHDGKWHDVWLGEILREEWDCTHCRPQHGPPGAA